MLSCPVECPISGFNLKRSKFCDGCDHKKIAEDFKKKVETEWRQKLGKASEKYRFERLHNLLLQVIGYEDVKADNLSVKSAYFLTVYLSERNKKERIENYLKEQENK